MILKLVSSDGITFDVDETIIPYFRTIQTIAEDIDPDDFIPIPNVTSSIMVNVIKYATKLRDNNDKDIVWKEEFMNIDSHIVIDLILAANYLDFQQLLEHSCQVIAKELKEKTPAEIRATFMMKDEE
jgi:S-phase kinase-associated protein 1